MIVMLVDDLGFSDISPYGGEIATPALDAIANEGFRLTNFRVTPLCSPSRAALLTGANPHRAGFGFVSHANPGYPGVSMKLPKTLPTLAEIYRSQGYSTFMVGKWHLTPEWELHDGAPKDSWPLQRGFDRYFGAMDGCTTLYHPHRLVRDNSPVTERFADDAYLTDRLTDEAISMIDGLRASDETRPFFLYFAHHAVHGPVQAKPADIDAERGSYDAGWDACREARIAKQKLLGIVDAALTLPDRDEGVEPWDALDAETQALYARHMEVYAAAVRAVDESVDRLLSHLKTTGDYENTIFVFSSDNGGTGEGGPAGTRSYFSQFTTMPSLPSGWVRDVARPLEELGGPTVHGHYPRGWAQVSNTPHRSYKGSALEGGIRSPLLISWPNGLPRHEEDDGVRREHAYVTDVAPTLLDLSGHRRPETLGDVRVDEIDGRSIRDDLASPFDGSDSQERTPGQYLGLLKERAYLQGNWKIRASDWGPRSDPDSAWELYDLEADPTESTDVAGDHPGLVSIMAEEWRRAAWHNTVFPLPDEPTFLATRPSTELPLERPITIRPGAPTLERFRSSRLIALRSFTITARFEPTAGEGVVVSHGDQGGGYILWTAEGDAWFAYNAYGDMHRLRVQASQPAEITLNFTALPDLAWSIDISVDGECRASLERVPMLVGMAPFTGISVGQEGGGPVDWDLHARGGDTPHRGGLLDVRYEPGAIAAYSRRIVVDVDELRLRLLD
ncbi:arylsulfatase [Pseudoclavibacter sp. RFBB5]|uniref:arylsulfatase n=1 Tax=Pseudoclavibacter sp. RFBB5 TaxID=2080574 RepID=UPI0015E1D27C|nr:arylsulfatase [Pseudoclavibacter sp. RFBB5]